MKAERRKKYSYRQIFTETIFKNFITTIGFIVVLLVFAIMLTLVVESWPSIQKFGFSFLWETRWDVNKKIYGALPYIIGTLLTSFIALFLSIPFSFAVAIFLGEYFPEGWIANLLRSTVELIAAIPSVIYGFWGLFVIVPIVRNFLTSVGVSSNGQGIFTSSLILAIMIIPYAASLGRSMIQMVPSNLKEAAYSLGATRWEVIRSVILPYTKSGLFAGVILSLGRAVGETMAVTMVIGNSQQMPGSIFAMGNTLASVIALGFGEATGALNTGALVELGLVLFLVTVVINMIGKRVIKKFANV